MRRIEISVMREKAGNGLNDSVKGTFRQLPLNLYDFLKDMSRTDRLSHH